MGYIWYNYNIQRSSSNVVLSFYASLEEATLHPNNTLATAQSTLETTEQQIPLTTPYG